MPKHLLFTATLVVFNCITTEAQVVRSSQHDELTAGRKAPLSTSKSSGSGAGPNGCWSYISASAGFLCPGADVTLTADYQGNDAQWYFNDIYTPIDGETSGSLVVTEPGIYYFGTNGSNGDFCYDGFSVTSVAPVYAPENNIICENGSVTIKAGINADAYKWYKDSVELAGKTDESIVVNEAGEYYVQTTSGSCTVGSELTNVTVYNAPATANISGDSCINGYITLNNENDNLNPESVSWYRDNVLIKTIDNKGVVVAGGNDAGNNLNQLNQPYGIYLDDEKNIYIADYNNYRIVKWKPGNTTGEIVVDNLNTVGDASSFPTDVIVEPSYTVVSAAIRSFIFPANSTAKNFNGAWGLSLDKDKSIYSTINGSISQYSSYGGHVEKTDMSTMSPTPVAGGGALDSSLLSLSFPNGLYVDSSYNIYVADNFSDANANYNGRIVKWAQGASAGELIAGGNGYGNAPNQIWFAADVTFDKLGNMYVSDAVNNRVQLWRPGADHGITIASGFTPWGIVVDDSLNLYVADQTNNAVRKFPSLLYNTITADAEGVYKAVVTYPGGCTVTSNDFVVKECGVLANNLLNFSAQLKNKNAELSWQTASEKNTSYFNVQRSLNGTNFTSIEKVYASNSNNTIHNYTYTDGNITSLGTNKIYYRLVQIDKDGSAVKSNVVFINLNKTGWSFTLNPNPVHNSVKVQLNNLYGVTNVSIIDMTGKKLSAQQINATGNNELHFNTAALTNGLYFIRVFNNNRTEYLKFVKQ